MGGFGNLTADAGLKSLNEYQASQADKVVYEAVKNAPSEKYENALRWFKHMSSFKNLKNLPGTAKALDQYGSACAKSAPVDDDDDLFGSDDDEAEAERQKALEAHKKKKATKKVVIAKSSIVLDVKPIDDETDMAEVERRVRLITTDGLLWGSSKFVDVAYGIKKLVICCVVEDDKVGTDFLEESIEAIDDLVQSVDIAAFNKI